MTNREDGYMTDQCTNWSKYDVPTIWSTVSDEGDSVSYAQVTAWRETSEAIDRQASTLRAARDELMAGWPPDKSSAAQEFMDQLNTVLLTMAYHSGVAAANSTALLGILRSLEVARDGIQSLYREWTVKTAKQGSESSVDKIVDAATFWSDKNRWQSSLNKQAAAIMYTSDVAISEHRQQMRAPASYSIDPEYAQPPVDLTFTNDDQGHSTGVTGIPVEPPDIASLTNSQNGISGPVLTTAIIGQDNGLPSTAGELSPQVTNDARQIGIAAAPLVGSFDRFEPSRILRSTPASTPTVEDIRPFAESENTPARLIGRGGIIGVAPFENAPMTGIGVGGRPIRSERDSRSRLTASPGGVIGGDRSHAITDAADRGRFGGSARTFDPDLPWEAAMGVPGIIVAPNKEHHHTSGTGVIGIDR